MTMKKIQNNLPNVPLSVECNQSLSFLQFIFAASTSINVAILWTGWLLKYLVLLLLCSRFRGTRTQSFAGNLLQLTVLLLTWFLWLLAITIDAFFAQYFFTRIGDLSKNRLF
jgi:hypothetical protein